MLWAAAFALALTVVAGGLVFVSGTVGIDAQTGEVAEGIEAQTDLALRNVAAILAEAGASMDDLVKTTIFVVNYKPADREVIAGVRSRFYGSRMPPASTLVGVQSLVLPELMIEVEALAVID